jgi:hypothetical protein
VAAAKEAQPQRRRQALAEEQTAGRLRRAMHMRGLADVGKGEDAGSEFLSVFDMALEPTAKKTRQASERPRRPPRFDPDTIVCNSLPMERLSLGEGALQRVHAASMWNPAGLMMSANDDSEDEGEEEEACSDDGDYVYDLYYAEGPTAWGDEQ